MLFYESEFEPKHDDLLLARIMSQKIQKEAALSLLNKFYLQALKTYNSWIDDKYNIVIASILIKLKHLDMPATIENICSLSILEIPEERNLPFVCHLNKLILLCEEYEKKGGLYGPSEFFLA